MPGRTLTAVLDLNESSGGSLGDGHFFDVDHTRMRNVIQIRA